MTPRLFRAASVLLVGGTALAILAMPWVHPRWRVLLDNMHWTCSFLVACLWGWQGQQAAPDRATRLARLWATRGAMALLGGQLVWNGMAAADWIPVPNPADPFFMMVGPLVATGLWRQASPMLRPPDLRAARLDAAGLLVATSSATLVLFLPWRGDASLLQVAVLVAYPLCMLLPAVVALVLMLKLRVWPTWRASLLPLSMVAFTLLWGMWNLAMLAGRTVDGGGVNVSFSLAALAMGAGIAVYQVRIREDAQWDRLCEAVLRMLPLMLVLLAAAGLLFVGAQGQLPRSARLSVQLGAVVVVGIAFVRQAVQLRDRDRLIVAERLLRQREAELEARVAERTRDLVAAREVAEAASQAKTDFLANMSHELRTPLNGVLGFAQLAAMGTRDPALLRHMARIEVAGKQLLRLINDILDMSRIEAGRVALESTRFELPALFRSVDSQLADLARSKGLALAWRVEAGAEQAVMGDPLRVEQILLNYVGNAIKFTEVGRVDVGAWVLKQDSEDLWLRVEVRDTGIGMDEQTCSRLFRAFEQADNSTTRRYGGSGLGLAICKRLAELMGGEVGVFSQPQVGSCFWFTARLAKAPARPQAEVVSGAQAPTWTSAPAGGPHVLLVEDNELNEVLACSILGHAGYQVTVAHSGTEALARLRTTLFDAVLMDIQMPDVDGLSVTRMVREEGVQPGVPIIAMTANARDSDREACLNAGMNDFVSKPLDVPLMLDKLARWTQAAGAMPVRASAAQG